MKHLLIIPGRVFSKNTWGYGKAPKGKKCVYAKAIAWEATAEAHALAQLRQRGLRDFPLFPSENVFMSIELRLHGKKRGDLQNYRKSICDSMEGVLYTNDKQITMDAGCIIEVDGKSKEQLTIWIEEDTKEAQELHSRLVRCLCLRINELHPEIELTVVR